MSAIDEPFITMKEAVLETRRDVKEIGEKLGTLATKAELQAHDNRLRVLETTAVTDTAMRKERKQMYRGAIAILASFVLPALAIVLGSGGYPF